MTRVLLTGASGFVGSHVLRHLLANTDWLVTCVASFQHRGLPARIVSAGRDFPDLWNRIRMVHWDMRSPADKLTLKELAGCDVIMNVASESHVDRSISHPVPFVENNVSLMLNVLEVARELGVRLFLQMSTDEVFGPAPEGYEHHEWDTILPSNPYSASKAAQEAIGIAYWRTYGVPLVMTNTMNIIGEMQDPEKFLPMIVRNLRDRRPVPVHVSEDGIAGSRFYLHARNLADAWLWLCGREAAMYPASQKPDRYNIVGEREVKNDELVHMVERIMGVTGVIKPVSFHSSRPGHDLRYALDGTKIGWKPPVPLEESIEKTVKWSLTHPEWLDL